MFHRHFQPVFSYMEIPIHEEIDVMLQFFCLDSFVFRILKAKIGAKIVQRSHLSDVVLVFLIGLYRIIDKAKTIVLKKTVMAIGGIMSEDSLLSDFALHCLLDFLEAGMSTLLKSFCKAITMLIKSNDDLYLLTQSSCRGVYLPFSSVSRIFGPVWCEHHLIEPDVITKRCLVCPVYGCIKTSVPPKGDCFSGCIGYPGNHPYRTAEKNQSDYLLDLFISDLAGRERRARGGDKLMKAIWILASVDLCSVFSLAILHDWKAALGTAEIPFIAIGKTLFVMS